jgi:hypothetical protein
MCWFLRPFIWDRDVILRWIRQRNSIKFCAELGKSAMETCSNCDVHIFRLQWRHVQTSNRGTKHEPYEESPNSPRPKNAREVKSKVKNMIIAFLWQQGDYCSQTISPGRPNGQFCIPLWRFMVTARKCAKTLSQTLATKELVVASQQCTVSHFLYHQAIFDQKHHCQPPPTLLFCFPDWRENWKAAILTKLRWSRQNSGGAEHSHNTTFRIHL